MRPTSKAASPATGFGPAINSAKIMSHRPPSVSSLVESTIGAGASSTALLTKIGT
jgi:hypothetical protein